MENFQVNENLMHCLSDNSKHEEQRQDTVVRRIREQAQLRKRRLMSNCSQRLAAFHHHNSPASNIEVTFFQQQPKPKLETMTWESNNDNACKNQKKTDVDQLLPLAGEENANNRGSRVIGNRNRSLREIDNMKSCNGRLSTPVDKDCRSLYWTRRNEEMATAKRNNEDYCGDAAMAEMITSSLKEKSSFVSSGYSSALQHDSSNFSDNSSSSTTDEIVEVLRRVRFFGCAIIGGLLANCSYWWAEYCILLLFVWRLAILFLSIVTSSCIKRRQKQRSTSSSSPITNTATPISHGHNNYHLSLETVDADKTESLPDSLPSSLIPIFIQYLNLASVIFFRCVQIAEDLSIFILSYYITKVACC